MHSGKRSSGTAARKFPSERLAEYLAEDLRSYSVMIGPVYASISSWDGDGKVVDRSDAARWTFGPAHPHRFVVTDPSGEEVLTVARADRYPFRTFSMATKASSIGTIRELSLLFNKYSIDFQDGLNCIVHLPLFGAAFHGRSSDGAGLQIEMQHHRVWLLRLDPELDDPRFIAALTFLHSQRVSS